MLIKSDLLQLRKTKEEDIDFVLNTEQNPENSEFIILWTRKQHIEAMKSQDKLHLIIETLDNKAVGYIILAGIENPNHCVELVRITVANKGCGYGRESIKLIQQYVFTSLHAHRLWLDVKEHNYRAKNLYDSTGFIYEGKLRECLKKGEEFESLILMGMLGSDYKKS